MADMGRPTRYSQELANTICERLALGESMRTVSSAKDMPAMSTIFRWLQEDRENFREQYARAKQESADAMAEDLLDISDDGVNDWMEKKYGKNADSTWVVNGEAVQRSKLRVDTRKWLMSKMKPKKYGDKLNLEGTVDGKLTIQTVDYKDADSNDTV